MTVYFVSLGCDKNLVDSEEMLGLLLKSGYSFCDVPEEADFIVVNTCGFICDAKEESINTILDMANYKTEGKCKALIVCGCLAQRYTDEIIKEIPEVDAILGTNSYLDIINAIDEAVLYADKKVDKPFVSVKEFSHVERFDDNQVLTTGGYYAYLKIAEGCAKNCTYCIIPSIRGVYRSVPIDKLIERAKLLVSKGARELILVAQETTLYGVDLYGKKSLCKLIEELAKIEELHWIRILYAYPEEITDELIDLMANEPKLCHYIDMPIQHASDKILKEMGRKTTCSDITAKIEKLRSKVPDVSIRTTVMVGFPGEDEADFDALYDFVNEKQFERLGAFIFSPEEGTKAAQFTNTVDENVAAERYDAIMSLQQEIATDFHQSLIGKEIEVMVEGHLVDEDVYVGRSYMDAPGVDGQVFINTSFELMSGDFVNVRITGASEYDLIGELTE